MEDEEVYFDSNELYGKIINSRLDYEIIDGNIIFNKENNRLIVFSPQDDIDALFYNQNIHGKESNGVLSDYKQFKFLISGIGYSIRERKR